MNPEAAAQLYNLMMAKVAAANSTTNSDSKPELSRSPVNSVNSHHSSNDDSSPKTESPSPTNATTTTPLDQLNQLWQIMLNRNGAGQLPPGIPNFMGFPNLPTPGFTMNPQEVSEKQSKQKISYFYACQALQGKIKQLFSI